MLIEHFIYSWINYLRILGRHRRRTNGRQRFHSAFLSLSQSFLLCSLWRSSRRSTLRTSHRERNWQAHLVKAYQASENVKLASPFGWNSSQHTWLTADFAHRMHWMACLAALRQALSLDGCFNEIKSLTEIEPKLSTEELIQSLMVSVQTLYIGSIFFKLMNPDNFDSSMD